MNLLRASSYKRMPWKNGGGETVEIAVFPANASVENFDWRISMATVASDGPFSIFPEIDRSLSILAGNGVALAIDGAGPISLTVDSQPLPFSADVPVVATLTNGAITDLNVMTRRGRFQHSAEQITGHTLVAKSSHDETAFLLATGDVTVTSGDQDFAIAALDSIEIDETVTLKADRIVCYIIRLMPHR